LAYFILGIDPGFSGAIATIASDTGLLAVEDMPVTKDPKGRTLLDLPRLFGMLTPPIGVQIHAVLEHVASRPGQGAPATFRFGQGYGAIQMALAAHKIPVQYTTPAQWKKYFGLSKDKQASRGLATQRFPTNADNFVRVKDDGRAEAALIALYGKEVLVKKTA
jgi:crossover junction endodeoxyribonuclease RuvC